MICMLSNDFGDNVNEPSEYYFKLGYPFVSLKKYVIRDNWNIIQNIVELSTICIDKPVMGFKRLQNLRDRLISAKIPYPPIDGQNTNS